MRTFSLVISTLAIALLPLSGFADDPIPTNGILQTLATVTNDRNTDVSTLSMVVGTQNDVLGIAFKTLHNSEQPPTTTEPFFSLADIESQNGVVLDHEEGYDAFLLLGSIDSQSGQGQLTIRYLENGWSGTYSECGVTVARGINLQWHLINYAQQIVTQIEVKSWSFGISTLQNVCQQ